MPNPTCKLQRPQKAPQSAALLLTAPDSEARLVGALLQKPELLEGVLSAVDIRADDFTVPEYEAVFEVMRKSVEAGLSFDVVLVAERLRGKVSAADIAALSDAEVPALPLCVEHAKAIKRRSAARRLVAAVKDVIKDIDAVEALKQDAQRAARHLSELLADGRSGTVNMAEACEKFLDRIKNPVKGISYGFKELDVWTAGMKSGEMIVLAGRPSMGKSTLATQIAVRAALNGYKVLMFSLEVSAEQIAQKAVSMVGGIPAQDLRSGRTDEAKLAECIDRLAGVRLAISDQGHQTPASVRAAVMSWKEREGLDMVVIDYLQLLNCDRKQGSRYEAVTEVSAAVKRLAKDAGVPVLVLSQLSREPEGRTNKRPALADLRDSGAIEGDADVVLLLYREKYYDPRAGDMAEIILAKQRHGPTGTVKVVFDPVTVSFREIEEADF